MNWCLLTARCITIATPARADIVELVRSSGFTRLEHATPLERVPSILERGLQLPDRSGAGLGGVPGRRDHGRAPAPSLQDRNWIL